MRLARKKQNELIVNGDVSYSSSKKANASPTKGRIAEENAAQAQGVSSNEEMQGLLITLVRYQMMGGEEDVQEKIVELVRSNPSVLRELFVVDGIGYSRSRRSVLSCAILSSRMPFQLETIQAIYEAWPEVLRLNHSTDLHEQPLYQAIRKERFDVIQFLAIADPSSLRVENGLSPLHFLLHQYDSEDIMSDEKNRNNFRETAKAMITADPMILTIKDDYFGGGDQTLPLHEACHTQHWDLVPIMLEANPSIALMSDDVIGTPLHAVCCHQEVPIEIFELLLEVAPEATNIKSVNNLVRPLEAFLMCQRNISHPLDRHPEALKCLVAVDQTVSIRYGYDALWCDFEWSTRFHWIQHYCKVQYNTPLKVSEAFPLHATLQCPPAFWKSYCPVSSMDDLYIPGHSIDDYRIGPLTQDNLMKKDDNGLLPLHMGLDQAVELKRLQKKENESEESLGNHGDDEFHVSLNDDSNKCDCYPSFLTLLKDMVQTAPESMLVPDPRNGDMSLIRMASQCSMNEGTEHDRFEVSVLYEMMQAAPIQSHVWSSSSMD